MEIKVFGMTNCAGCDTVKRLLKESGVEYHYYDVMHHADMEEASKYNIRSVPTVVMPMQLSYGMVVGSDAKAIAQLRDMVGI